MKLIFKMNGLAISVKPINDNILKTGDIFVGLHNSKKLKFKVISTQSDFIELGIFAKPIDKSNNTITNKLSLPKKTVEIINVELYEQ